MSFRLIGFLNCPEEPLMAVCSLAKRAEADPDLPLTDSPALPSIRSAQPVIFRLQLGDVRQVYETIAFFFWPLQGQRLPLRVSSPRGVIPGRYRGF